MVCKIVENIGSLELTVKEIESKEYIIASEAAKNVEKFNDVIKKKDSSNDS